MGGVSFSEKFGLKHHPNFRDYITDQSMGKTFPEEKLG